MLVCNSKQLDSQSGQTLIEVIIAIGLIVMVLTTLASGLALSVRNNRFARDQALSKEYVRQAIEWIRSMRDQLGWDAFEQTILSDGSTVKYCLDTIPSTVTDFDSKIHTPTCTFPISGTPFIRSITLVPNGLSDQVDVSVLVQWTEGSKTFSSQSTLLLKKWQ